MNTSLNAKSIDNNMYWLILYPNIFIWTKKNQVLLYNSETGEKYLSILNDKIEQICKSIKKIRNLFSVKISLSNDEICNNWIENICRKKMGEIIPLITSSSKPVSIPPIPMVGDKNVNLTHLNEISIYIGGTEERENSYYKQFLHPIKCIDILSVEKIDIFLSKVTGYNLQIINIVGADSLSDHAAMELSNIIMKYNIETNFITRVDNIDFYIKFYSQNCNATLVVVSHSLDEYNSYEDIRMRFCNIKNEIIVTDEMSYYLLMNNKCKDEFDIVPFFTGDNKDFFEKYIYMDKMDIESLLLTKVEIFRNQLINSLFFGKLTVMPDGKVYSHIESVPLGAIDDSIYSLLKNVSVNKIGWFSIRNKQPCCTCVYQWLCPPISNYEIAIGRLNLCKVK